MKTKTIHSILAIATCFAVAPVTQASLEFNGSNSYTIINDSFLEGVTTSTFTFDFWIKPAEVDKWAQLWSKTESWKEWAFGGMENGGVGFFQGWPHSYYTIESPPNVLKANTWQHIMIVGDGTVGQIYIDGVAIPTTGALYGQLSFNANATGSAIGPMVWGLRDNTTLPDDGWFRGSLANFRVWDRALSAAEVAAFHNTPPSDTAPGLRHHLPLHEMTGSIMQDVIGGIQGATFETQWSADNPPTPLLDIGLVAYYPLNGSANDESGNGNDGISRYTANDVDRFGIPDKSMSFNGTTSELSVNKTLLDLGQDYTISLWFKLNDISLLQQPLVDSHRSWGLAIMYNDAPSTPPRVINWAVGAGTFGWTVGGGEFGEKHDYESGRWYQLLFVKDQHDYKMYIDGELESALTVTNDFSFSPPTWDFGFGADSSAYLNGNLDDIRIYNRALSKQEVAELHDLERPKSLADGLVAYYPFNGNGEDIAGSNPMVLSNLTFGADRFGQVSNTLLFDGIQNSLAQSTRIVSPSVADSFTMSIWAKPQQKYDPHGYASVGNVLIQPIHGSVNYGGGHAGVGLMLGTDGVGIIAHSDGYAPMPVEYRSNLNGWHHFVVSYDRKRPSLYVDGVLVGSAQADPGYIFHPSSGDPNIPGEFWIPIYGGVGFWAQWNNPGNLWDYSRFSGSVDDFRIYDRALSDQDINALYEYEAPPKPSITDGMVLYYPFNGNGDDQSGNGNNGLLHNVTPATDRFGNPSGCFSFSGSESYIEADRTISDVTNTFTISMWAQTSAVRDHYLLFPSQGTSAWGDDSVGAGLWLSGNTIAVQEHTVGYMPNVVGAVGDFSKWTQVTLVYSNQVPRLYLNSVLVATGQKSPRTVRPSSGLHNTAQFAAVGGFGGFRSIGTTDLNWFQGSLDDIRIYNRALSAQEVSDLYDSERVPAAPTVTA
ncbi:MAG: LamG domain-containing protein [Limisphaerales bacterium]